MALVPFSIYVTCFRCSLVFNMRGTVNFVFDYFLEFLIYFYIILIIIMKINVYNYKNRCKNKKICEKQRLKHMKSNEKIDGRSWSRNNLKEIIMCDKGQSLKTLDSKKKLTLNIQYKIWKLMSHQVVKDTLHIPSTKFLRIQRFIVNTSRQIRTIKPVMPADSLQNTDPTNICMKQSSSEIANRYVNNLEHQVISDRVSFIKLMKDFQSTLFSSHCNRMLIGENVNVFQKLQDINVNLKLFLFQKYVSQAKYSVSKVFNNIVKQEHLTTLEVTKVEKAMKNQEVNSKLNKVNDMSSFIQNIVNLGKLIRDTALRDDPKCCVSIVKYKRWLGYRRGNVFRRKYACYCNNANTKLGEYRTLGKKLKRRYQKYYLRKWHNFHTFTTKKMRLLTFYLKQVFIAKFHKTKCFDFDNNLAKRSAVYPQNISDLKYNTDLYTENIYKTAFFQSMFSHAQQVMLGKVLLNKGLLRAQISCLNLMDIPNSGAIKAPHELGWNNPLTQQYIPAIDTYKINETEIPRPLLSSNYRRKESKPNYISDFNLSKIQKDEKTSQLKARPSFHFTHNFEIINVIKKIPVDKIIRRKIKIKTIGSQKRFRIAVPRSIFTLESMRNWKQAENLRLSTSKCAEVRKRNRRPVPVRRRNIKDFLDTKQTRNTVRYKILDRKRSYYSHRFTNENLKRRKCRKVNRANTIWKSHFKRSITSKQNIKDTLSSVEKRANRNYRKNKPRENMRKIRESLSAKDNHGKRSKIKIVTKNSSDTLEPITKKSRGMEHTKRNNKRSYNETYFRSTSIKGNKSISQTVISSKLKKEKPKEPPKVNNFTEKLNTEGSLKKKIKPVTVYRLEIVSNRKRKRRCRNCGLNKSHRQYSDETSIDSRHKIPGKYNNFSSSDIDCRKIDRLKERIRDGIYAKFAQYQGLKRSDPKDMNSASESHDASSTNLVDEILKIMSEQLLKRGYRKPSESTDNTNRINNHVRTQKYEIAPSETMPSESSEGPTEMLTEQRCLTERKTTRNVKDLLCLMCKFANQDSSHARKRNKSVSPEKVKQKHKGISTGSFTRLGSFFKNRLRISNKHNKITRYGSKESAFTRNKLRLTAQRTKHGLYDVPSSECYPEVPNETYTVKSPKRSRNFSEDQFVCHGDKGSFTTSPVLTSHKFTSRTGSRGKRILECPETFEEEDDLFHTFQRSVSVSTEKIRQKHRCVETVPLRRKCSTETECRNGEVKCEGSGMGPIFKNKESSSLKHCSSDHRCNAFCGVLDRRKKTAKNPSVKHQDIQIKQMHSKATMAREREKPLRGCLKASSSTRSNISSGPRKKSVSFSDVSDLENSYYDQQKLARRTTPCRSPRYLNRSGRKGKTEMWELKKPATMTYPRYTKYSGASKSTGDSKISTKNNVISKKEPDDKNQRLGSSLPTQIHSKDVGSRQIDTSNKFSNANDKLKPCGCSRDMDKLKLCGCSIELEKEIIRLRNKLAEKTQTKPPDIRKKFMHSKGTSARVKDAAVGGSIQSSRSNIVTDKVSKKMTPITCTDSRTGMDLGMDQKIKKKARILTPTQRQFSTKTSCLTKSLDNKDYANSSRECQRIAASANMGKDYQYIGLSESTDMFSLGSSSRRNKYVSTENIPQKHRAIGTCSKTYPKEFSSKFRTLRQDFDYPFERPTFKVEKFERFNHSQSIIPRQNEFASKAMARHKLPLRPLQVTKGNSAPYNGTFFMPYFNTAARHTIKETKKKPVVTENFHRNRILPEKMKIKEIIYKGIPEFEELKRKYVVHPERQQDPMIIERKFSKTTVTDIYDLHSAKQTISKTKSRLVGSAKSQKSKMDFVLRNRSKGSGKYKKNKWIEKSKQKHQSANTPRTRIFRLKEKGGKAHGFFNEIYLEPKHNTKNFKKSTKKGYEKETDGRKSFKNEYNRISDLQDWDLHDFSYPEWENVQLTQSMTVESDSSTVYVPSSNILFSEESQPSRDSKHLRKDIHNVIKRTIPPINRYKDSDDLGTSSKLDLIEEPKSKKVCSNQILSNYLSTKHSIRGNPKIKSTRSRRSGGSPRRNKFVSTEKSKEYRLHKPSKKILCTNTYTKNNTLLPKNFLIYQTSETSKEPNPLGEETYDDGSEDKSNKYFLTDSINKNMIPRNECMTRCMPECDSRNVIRHRFLSPCKEYASSLTDYDSTTEQTSFFHNNTKEKHVMNDLYGKTKIKKRNSHIDVDEDSLKRLRRKLTKGAHFIKRKRKQEPTKKKTKIKKCFNQTEVQTSNPGLRTRKVQQRNPGIFFTKNPKHHKQKKQKFKSAKRKFADVFPNNPINPVHFVYNLNEIQQLPEFITKEAINNKLLDNYKNVIFDSEGKVKKSLEDNKHRIISLPLNLSNTSPFEKSKYLFVSNSCSAATNKKVENIRRREHLLRVGKRQNRIRVPAKLFATTGTHLIKETKSEPFSIYKSKNVQGECIEQFTPDADLTICKFSRKKNESNEVQLPKQHCMRKLRCGKKKSALQYSNYGRWETGSKKHSIAVRKLPSKTEHNLNGIEYWSSSMQIERIGNVGQDISQQKKIYEQRKQNSITEQSSNVPVEKNINSKPHAVDRWKLCSDVKKMHFKGPCTNNPEFYKKTKEIETNMHTYELKQTNPMELSKEICIDRHNTKKPLSSTPMLKNSIMHNKTQKNNFGASNGKINVSKTKKQYNMQVKTKSRLNRDGVTCLTTEKNIEESPFTGGYNFSNTMKSTSTVVTKYKLKRVTRVLSEKQVKKVNEKEAVRDCSQSICSSHFCQSAVKSYVNSKLDRIKTDSNKLHTSKYGRSKYLPENELGLPFESQKGTENVSYPNLRKKGFLRVGFVFLSNFGLNKNWSPIKNETNENLRLTRENEMPEKQTKLKIHFKQESKSKNSSCARLVNRTQRWNHDENVKQYKKDIPLKTKINEINDYSGSRKTPLHVFNDQKIALETRSPLNFEADFNKNLTASCKKILFSEKCELREKMSVKRRHKLMNIENSFIGTDEPKTNCSKIFSCKSEKNKTKLKSSYKRNKSAQSVTRMDKNKTPPELQREGNKSRLHRTNSSLRGRCIHGSDKKGISTNKNMRSSNRITKKWKSKDTKKALWSEIKLRISYLSALKNLFKSKDSSRKRKEKVEEKSFIKLREKAYQSKCRSNPKVKNKDVNFQSFKGVSKNIHIEKLDHHSSIDTQFEFIKMNKKFVANTWSRHAVNKLSNTVNNLDITSSEKMKQFSTSDIERRKLIRQVKHNQSVKHISTDVKNRYENNHSQIKHSYEDSRSRHRIYEGHELRLCSSDYIPPSACLSKLYKKSIHQLQKFKCKFSP